MTTAHHTPDVITVFGRNLVDDLIGKLGFTEMIGLVMTQGTPLPPSHLEVIDALLVTFTDHGVTPSSMAARLTLLGAPEAMQGAVAAGISGAGSRFLGTLENSARDLSAVVATEPNADPAHRARVLVESARVGGRPVIGIGHPEHKIEDPRVPKLLEIASHNALAGSCVAVLLALPQAMEEATGRTLPVNGAGLAGALLADMGYSPSFARGIAIISRAAGLVGQLLDEETDGQARSLWDRERRRAAANEDKERQD